MLQQLWHEWNETSLSGNFTPELNDLKWQALWRDALFQQFLTEVFEVCDPDPQTDSLSLQSAAAEGKCFTSPPSLLRAFFIHRYFSHWGCQAYEQGAVKMREPQYLS